MPGGLLRETLAALGPLGLHTTARELQTCTFERPGASNTTKIPREDPPEREERMKFPAGEKKKRKMLGPHPFGPPTPSNPHPFEPPTTRSAHHPTRPPPNPKKNWPNAVWPHSVKQNWPNSAK